MDIFFGSTATFVNNLQQATTVPERSPPAQQPQPTQGSTVDFSGKDAQKNNNHSGGLDSLGGGNVL